MSVGVSDGNLGTSVGNEDDNDTTEVQISLVIGELTTTTVISQLV